MTNSVIIVLLCASLAAWIAWLIYNYAVFNKQIAIEAKVSYWKNKCNNLRACIDDLVSDIHMKFPKSTVRYNHTDEIDEVIGEIKY